MKYVIYSVSPVALDLQERGQRLLAEARRKAQEMGTSYLCHPANRVTRLEKPLGVVGVPRWFGKR